MNWFFIAIISPFLSSIIHHTDKYLLTKFSKEHSIGSLILFSSIFPILVLPFFALTKVNFLMLAGEQIFVLIGTGILSALSLLFYFYALEEEETSVIVPMYQLMPIFGYFLGIVILNEILDFKKILAAIMVLLGAAILSFELKEEGGIRFKLKPTLFMLSASILLALNDVIFKKMALLNHSYTISIFWSLVGYGIFGLTMLLLMKRYQQSFFHTVKTHGTKYLGVNLVNESFQTLATLSFSYALLLAPIALVMLVESYQPLFVFIIGIILTKYFPHIATERISGKHLFHKFSAIAIVVIGSIFVYY